MKQIQKIKAQDETVGSLVALGDLYLTKGDTLEARHYFMEAIDKYPGSIEGYLRMGAFSYLQKKPKEASNYYEQALDHDSKSLEALLGLVKVHILLQGYSRAKTYADKAHKIDPDSAEVTLFLGLIELSMHNLPIAEPLLLTPNIADHPALMPYRQFYLGILFLKRGLHQKALDYFHSIVDHEEYGEFGKIHSVTIRNNIGVAEFRMGNYIKAQETFDALVKDHPINSPENVHILINQAQVYWIQDNTAQALAILRQAHALEPKSWPWMNETEEYLSGGSAVLKAKLDGMLKDSPIGINIGLYLGCVIPNRYPFIDSATRHILNALEVGVVELEGAGCCPAPGVFRSFDINTWLTLGARNITIAEDLNRNMAIMCNGCFGTLNDINTELKEDKVKREYVNDKLKEIGKEFKGIVDAEHLVWVLYNDVGIETIKKKIVNKLNYKVAVHYGCHIIKPAHNKPWKDDFEMPTFLDELVEITGCTSVNYRDKLMCCGAGGGLRGSEKEISLDFTRDKLESMREVGVDLIIDCCPFCHLQLDLGQMEINGLFKDKIAEPFKIPVIYISQLLGLAMGIDPFRLGLLRAPQKKGLPPFSPVDPLFTTIMEDIGFD